MYNFFSFFRESRIFLEIFTYGKEMDLNDSDTMKFIR